MAETLAGRQHDGLRDRAEALLRVTRRDVATLPVADLQHVIHELQVHQIELEMQNEGLRVATTELEESRAQYRELYDFAPIGYLELDSSGVILNANLAAATLLGLPRQPLLGRPFSEFVDVSDTLVLHQHLRETARSLRATHDVRLVGPSEAPVHVLLVTSCDAAPTAGYLMALLDVTDRRRAEDALHAANEKLEARVAERTRALAEQNVLLEQELAARVASEEERGQLEKRLRDAERLEGLGLLAGGVAHDFNNLLVGVLGTADLLLQRTDLPPGDLRESLAVIKRAARSATDLTRQMLTYAGRSHANLEPLHLRTAIDDCLQLLAPSLPEHLDIRTELAHPAPPIEADPGQIRQVITNLVTNAVEALRGPSGTLVVRTRREELDDEALARYAHAPGAKPGAFLVLEVTDNGRGMDVATLSRVFDPFFTTKATGRGLGLASVLGIVQAHQGALRARSTSGQGTTFEIAWPVSTRPTAIRTSSIPAARPLQETGRVLVVDDDEQVLRAVERQLSFLGFETTTAGDGDEGLRLFREAKPPFSLVVLDRTMPGLSGDQVLVLLRQIDPHVPVVLMSGWNADQLELPAETVMFLPKPMTLSDLRRAIGQVLAARPTPTDQ